MCIAPITVYVGLKGDKFPVQTACHKCWQCIENAINDWVGRNIAEKQTSFACFAITLTYGRDEHGNTDHLRAALLTYRDVQLYLKLLRRHLGKVRYFVTGEYGSTKGRAHWHIMLYWEDVNPAKRSALTERWFEGGDAWRNDPITKQWVTKKWAAGEIPLDWNFNDIHHWPHGYSFWTEPTHKAIRYNCKYIQKDQTDAERQGHLAMSKKPPIGSAYFADLAERYVAQGIAPQNLSYKFPDVSRVNKQGVDEVVEFRLADRSAELFLEHFIRTWRAKHGDDNWPTSELVDNFHGYGRVILDANRAERLAGDRAGGFARYVEEWKASNAEPEKPRTRLAWRWDPGAFERIDNGKQ